MISGYNLFGIPLIDTLFTLVIKGLFVYFIIIMLYKLIENFRKGNMAQFVVNIVVGLLLLVLIIGPDVIAGWAGQLKTNLPK